MSETEKYIFKKMKYWRYKNEYPECETLGDYDKDEKTITVILPAEYAKRKKPMRWPEEFERLSSQRVCLKGTDVVIYQWGSGRNKSFLVEKTGLHVWEQSTWTIPGRGDEAMKLAIEKAKSLA